MTLRFAHLGMGALLPIVLLVGLAMVSHAVEWHVPNAPLRFTLELTTPPTHAAAGYFVHLPDGGVLPNTKSFTQVVAEDGTPVESAQLWRNRLGGLALVFAPPLRGTTVYVYMSRARRPNLWTPNSSIHPSAILCVDPTTDRMQTAKSLSTFGTVGPAVHYDDLVGYKKASYCIGGDLSGHPRPCAFYLLSHLVTKAPGKTWISYFTLDGTTEIRVNGRVIVQEKRIDKWGGTGAYVELKKGLNRFEVFQTASGTGGFDTRKTGGLMYLTWRTPNATMHELGGVRSAKVPMSGTSRMETRTVRNDEIARSGKCRLLGLRSRDGLPLAAASATARHLFWLGDEKPILMYKLDAFTRGNADETEYSWQFNNEGTAVSGTKLNWIFPGLVDNQVKLTASLGNRRSQSMLSFYSYGHISTDLNDAATRKDFLDASLTMFRAAPRSVDPMASCGSAYWRMLSHVVTIGEGYELFTHLISERLPLLSKHLPAGEIECLQDVVLDAAPCRDVGQAVAWIHAQRKQTSNRSYLNKLALSEAEIRMHYLGESNTVNRLLGTLMSQSGESAEIARIRHGDLAFISGDLNRATAMYADVQNRVRHHRNAGQPSGLRGVGLGGGHVDNWKLTAFLGVSASETVKSLIDQGQLMKARETLQAWERQFPLSKVSGDFVLQEARYYMALKDWVRARSMLEPYCNMIDASSYIPDASLALLTCMVNMKAPQEEIRTFCEQMSERLEFHPAGKTFRSYLGRP